MTLPLYRNIAAPNAIPGGAHPGLWFERFFSAWGADYSDIGEKERSPWLRQFQTAGDKTALETQAKRTKALAQSRQGATRIYQCTGNFISGVGNAHPLENGFTWHPTLGVPYLPGSAVKGLARAAVETAYAGEDKAEILKRWFGSEDKGSEHVSESAGQLIFLDALPTQPCALHAEVMTPHMGKWYEQGGKTPSKPETMPGDWHSPVPVPYLVARGLQLLFAILPRTSAAAEELDSVWNALDYALLHLGAGAKTAIGFGVMQTEEQRKEQEKTEAEASAENWEGALFRYNRKNGMFTAEKDGQTASALGDEGKQRFASLPPDVQRTLQGGRPVRGTARIARQDKDIKLLSVSAPPA